MRSGARCVFGSWRIQFGAVGLEIGEDGSITFAEYASHDDKRMKVM